MKRYREVIHLKRSCGILIALSSLPDGAGSGDLGGSARTFVDFLARAGQSLWQVLPLTRTDGLLGNSPYSSPSAFAGDTLYLALDDLADQGLLSPSDLTDAPSFPDGRTDYDAVRAYRDGKVRLAFRKFVPDGAYYDFLKRQRYWLTDYTLFTALKEHFGGRPWNLWPEPLRRREPDALSAAAAELREEMDYLAFGQFLFFSQLERLRKRCAAAGTELLGDLPIYVHYDSADVWAHPGFFRLDAGLLPVEVAGVPPDYFSATGQLWGNPLYDWDALERDRFSWWIERLRHALSMYHLVRIDHFRGLVACWSVPFGARTAEKGVWRPVPFASFFDAVRSSFPDLPFLAENLGIITPDVREAIAGSGLPGMAVLLFAFGGDTANNPHMPHNHGRNLAVYSGTHDNDTALGWFRSSPDEVRLLREYVGHPVEERDAADRIVRLTLSSVADRAIIPLQDYLGLGSEARMNTPSTAKGNWTWRAPKGCLSEGLAERLKKLALLYGRA